VKLSPDLKVVGPLPRAASRPPKTQDQCDSAGAPSAPREQLCRPLSSYLAPALLAAGLALILAGFAGLDRIFYEQVSRRLNTESSPLDRDFYAVTRPFWLLCRYAFAHALGGTVIYSLLVGLHPRGFRTANCGLVAVLAAALLANLLQAQIGRLRPNRSYSTQIFQRSVAGRVLPNGTSFPSGEAATAFAIAAVLRRAWPRGRYGSYALAVLASIARLVNGAHFISDVAAGAVFGFAVASAVYRYADRYYQRVTSAIWHPWFRAVPPDDLPGSTTGGASSHASDRGPQAV
jgi:membrane-associated phospholipid phosphatase